MISAQDTLQRAYRGGQIWRSRRNEEEESPLEKAIISKPPEERALRQPYMEPPPPKTAAPRPQPTAPQRNYIAPPIERPEPAQPSYSFDRNAVNDAYRQYLGRDAGEDDYAAHSGNVGGTEGVLAAIRESPEAKARAQQQQQPSPYSGPQYGAGGGENAYTGFDFDQAESNRDVNKSAKYAFAQLTGMSGVPMPRTKQEAESYALQYIVPGMEQLGYKVHQVVGDKMFISTRENPNGEWVDFLKNADGENPEFAWQSEGPGGAGGGDPLSNAILGQGGSVGADPTSTLSESDFTQQLIQQLLAELQK